MRQTVHSGTLAGLLSVFLAVSFLFCSDDEDGVAPVNVAGDYALTLVNGVNGCNYQPWNVGDTMKDIHMVIEQANDSIFGTVQGATGLWLDLLFGAHVFKGAISGNHLSMTLISRALQNGNCAYTVNAVTSANLSGDNLVGGITYMPATNGIRIATVSPDVIRTSISPVPVHRSNECRIQKSANT